jgi:DNA-binding response OmpR family regulator
VEGKLMITRCTKVLFVGNFDRSLMFADDAIAHWFKQPVQLFQVSTYHEAIEAVQQPFDAVLVTLNFDGHSGLEFIHHARLLNARMPLILVSQVYDASLDYKARQIGATDLISKNALPV